MHQLQTLCAVKSSCLHAQALEVIEEVHFDVNKPRFRRFHTLCVNTECQILGLGKSVIACLHLMHQHACVFVAHVVVRIVLMPDGNARPELPGIRGHVHEAQLKMHRAVKEVEKGTPFLKDLLLILLLGKQVVDILKLDGLRVEILPDTADPVLKHPLKRNALLCCTRDSVIALSVLYDFRDSFLILTSEIFRYLKFPFLFFPEQVSDTSVQSPLPPSLPVPAASVRRNSCPSGTPGLSAG